jgi:hypothetical protein
LSTELLYSTYLTAAATLARTQRAVQMKVAKALMPTPNGFPRGYHLTRGANGYIVLSGAVGSVEPSALSIIY